MLLLAYAFWKRSVVCGASGRQSEHWECSHQFRANGLKRRNENAMCRSVTCPFSKASVFPAGNVLG